MSKKNVCYLFKTTQMGCVYVLVMNLRLMNSSFALFGQNEQFWSASDDFITLSRLQSTQDCNVVEVFWSEESKMATSVFVILDSFSLVWVPMYQQSKSTFYN